MTTALSYSFVKNTPDGKVFGMQVAILDCVKALFKYGAQEKWPILCRAERSQSELIEIAAEIGLDKDRLVFLHAPYSADTLNQFTSVFRIDPMPGTLLLDRSQGADFAFCGLAHALAGVMSGRILERYILHPAFPWDALICPSHAIQQVVRRFWELYADYLATRFNVKTNCPVQLPVIPLGVDLDKMFARVNPQKRVEQRRLLNVDDDTIIVLWVGRLSASIKAHPIAMFRALELAAQKTKQNIQFVMQGYFAPAEAELDFRNLAKDFCPSVVVRFVSSNHPVFPDGVWAAADIFLSLIDNIQESFGLTPIEAIAAGLPRIISDWDGYRDSVTHGVDGFLVPTTQPPPDMGRALAASVLGDTENYADYMAKTSLCVAVDFHNAAEKLALLIQNVSLRQSLADAARKRLSSYDWKNIIPQYEQLWGEQAAKRCQNATSVQKVRP